MATTATTPTAAPAAPIPATRLLQQFGPVQRAARASDLISQLIASYQSSAANVSQSTDPMSIITSTLASAGIDL
jgi:hypothetical protein